MSPREFDQLVERAVRKIPPHFRSRLHNVAFVVEPESSNPNLLGLYHGIPLPHRSVQQSFTMPDRITIYQRPHERLAHSPAHLRKMVEDTVWHEVAHYFGLDEAEVRSAERRREGS
jgi:predicted Zn-dependent protease with MMP-like domain